MSLTFYHSPNSRSSSVRVLLEELGAPHDMRVLNMKAGEQRGAAYLAVNPMGKVPAIVDDGALVTEQVAIFLYLADRFPQARLAPAIGDPSRGPYLRFMAFYSSAFEPAVVDRAMKRTTEPLAMSPYGTYDAVMELLHAQLAKGPYLLGETFTAADILWAAGLQWTMGFGIVPRDPDFEAYVLRVTSRPSFQRVMADEQKLAAEHAAAVEAKGA